MDGLQWAVQTAETFMSASDLQGYHPELAKRCLCAGDDAFVDREGVGTNRRGKIF